MTSQDELRDRIAEIVNAALVAWNTDMDTQDSEGEYTAQAIIDEYGLEIEWQSMRGMGPNGPDRSWRVVGKWEKK